MMGLYFMKSLPFKNIYIHPLVRDEKGEKMSKSKGNVIDPLELINLYGRCIKIYISKFINSGQRYNPFR